MEIQQFFKKEIDHLIASIKRQFIPLINPQKKKQKKSNKQFCFHEWMT